MKKYFLKISLLFIGVITFSGCSKGSNKITCSQIWKRESEFETRVIAVIEDDKVNDVEVEIIFEDEKSANTFYESYNKTSFGKSTKPMLSGKIVILKNGAYIFEEDDDATEEIEENIVIGESRIDFINKVEKLGFECK